MMPPKIFVCFTCPAITARVAPGFTQQTDAGSELPERDPVNRCRMTLGRIIQFGERLLLDGDDRDAVAQRASGVEDEKWESAVTSNQPERHTARHLRITSHRDTARPRPQPKMIGTETPRTLGMHLLIGNQFFSAPSGPPQNDPAL